MKSLSGPVMPQSANTTPPPPHQVVSNTGSIIYYKSDQKSIDGTSVLI